MDDLPNGFTYAPIGSNISELTSSAERASAEVTYSNGDSAELFEGTLTKDRIRAGDFIIELDEITMSGLVRMRKLLPRDMYQSIKNRKSSRLIRTKKKLQTLEMD